jgi:hypothetical protein
MSEIVIDLAAPQTDLYSHTRKRITDFARFLEDEKITPWVFLHTRGVRVSRADGKEISISGVLFEGSPREVFWNNYIEIFLEDEFVSIPKETIAWVKDDRNDPMPFIFEAGELYKILIHKIYNVMADVDRTLRGRGYPNKIDSKNVNDKITAMNAYVDGYIKAFNVRASNCSRNYLINIYLYNKEVWNFVCIVSTILAAIAAIFSLI